MDIISTTAIVTGLVTLFGGAVLIIISASTTLGVAYLAFRFGWSKFKTSLGSGDSMYRSAMARGRILNRRDNILQ